MINFPNNPKNLDEVNIDDVDWQFYDHMWGRKEINPNATIAEKPPKDPTLGAEWLNLTTGLMAVWDGKNWIGLSLVNKHLAGPLVLKFIVNSTAPSTVTLNIDDINDGIIDWGDGTIEPILKGIAPSPHAYTVTKTSSVIVTISSNKIIFNKTNGVSQSICTEVVSWGEANFGSDLSNLFKDSALQIFAKGVPITNKVTNISGMFQGCANLGQQRGMAAGSNIDLSGINTRKVTDMSNLFDGCSILTGFTGIGDIDTSSCTDMSNMFKGCEKTTDVDVSKWDVSKVTTMESMFQNCTALHLLDPSKWKTTSLTNIDNMFNGCPAETALNISSWDITKLTTATDFLKGDPLPTYLYKNILIAWAAQTPLISGVNINFGTVATLKTTGPFYLTRRDASAVMARTKLTTAGWTITDAGGTFP